MMNLDFKQLVVDFKETSNPGNTRLVTKSWGPKKQFHAYALEKGGVLFTKNNVELASDEWKQSVKKFYFESYKNQIVAALEKIIAEKQKWIDFDRDWKAFSDSLPKIRIGDIRVGDVVKVYNTGGDFEVVGSITYKVTKVYDYYGATFGEGQILDYDGETGLERPKKGIVVEEAIRDRDFGEKIEESMKNRPTPRIWGKKIQIVLPNGEKRDAQFAIFELSDLTASHDERTFAPSPGYPLNAQGRNANDRNYTADKQAQALVEEYARDLQPELLITTSRSPEGTPIVTKEGIVVSGNNRTMSLKRAAADYPQRYIAYSRFLSEELGTFGIPAEADALSHFRHPVLVRVDYDIPAITTEELAKYNQATTKGKRPVDRSIELSARLIENRLCGTNIPQIVGAFETMTDFYADRRAQIALKDQLLGCNLLTQQDLPNYFDLENGFNEEGKTFIERTLSAAILSADALQAAETDGVKKLRAVVTNALPALLENKGLPAEASLIAWVNEAVIFQQKMVASKLSFADFLGQQSIFADSDDNWTRPAVVLNRMMNAGQRGFKTAILKYNETVQANAGPSLFGASETVSPAEAFENFMVGTLQEGERKVIERRFPTAFGLETVAAPEPPAPKHTPARARLAHIEMNLLTKRLPKLTGEQARLANVQIRLLTKFLSKA